MTDNPPTALNTFDYGFLSNHWMLKAALAYVPPKQLYVAIVAAIDWLIYQAGNGEDNVDLTDLLDVIAQAAFTGKYTPTSDDAPRWSKSPSEPQEERATVEPVPAAPIVDEAAIEAFGNWLSNLPSIADEDRNTNPKEETTA